MEALKQLVGMAPIRSVPSTIDTDSIYPLHFLDDTKTLREIVVTWTLRFNDVLDADKLHASLLELLDIGDWRKIGGRLRLKENGKLEIHVPTPFTVARPPTIYTHQDFSVNIEDHPLAKQLPKATNGPSIQTGPETFRIFAVREDAPASLDDFIYSDVPMLSLHITSFNDATLVGLSWPHTLMDVMGQQALLHAWSLVIAGRDSEVQPLLGARADVIGAAADVLVEGGNEEVFKLGALQLKGWNMLKFGLLFGWNMLWNRVLETKTVFLPQSVMTELRRQAQADLAVSDGGEDDAFISDGDILTAWTTKAIISSLPQPRPATVIHALNLRFRLPSLIQAPGVFIQNMAVGAFAMISSEIVTGSLGALALENRRHLMEQATEGQVLACFRYLKSGPHDPSMVCGNSNALLIPWTNWSRAMIFQAADFSAAIVRAGGSNPARINPPGSIVSHHASSMRSNAAARNVVVLLGQDLGENYWMMGVLLPPAWAKLEAEIKRLGSV